MIGSINHSGLRRAFKRGDFSRLPPEHRKKIRVILTNLDAATAPKEVDAPRHRLHRLTADRKGYYAVHVSANWRIVFRFEDGAFCDVNFEDYH